jgi:hypothetical protein
MRFSGRAPVIVTGPDGVTQGQPIERAACGTADAVRVPAVLTGGVAAALCRDAAACCARYRAGASPESYGVALRGQAAA